MQSNMGDMLGINPVEEEGGMDMLQDPQMQNLTGTEGAAPEEEQALGDALISLKEWLASDEGLAAVANMFQQSDKELWEAVPLVGKMMLEKVHTEMPEAPPSIYFGEGGLLQQVPPMLFEVAEVMGVPGSDDEDQLAAATMGLYKEVGQYLTESGDQDARKEAMKLGAKTLLTGEDGEMMTPEQLSKKGEAPAPKKKNDVRNSVTGILGV